MFDTASASNGVKLALLEGQLLTREIDRPTFIERTANLGFPAPAIGDAADKFMAIAANQAARRASLRSSYDYIVVGSAPPARLWHDAWLKTRMRKCSCSKREARI